MNNVESDMCFSVKWSKSCKLNVFHDKIKTSHDIRLPGEVPQPYMSDKVIGWTTHPLKLLRHFQKTWEADDAILTPQLIADHDDLKDQK